MKPPCKRVSEIDHIVTRSRRKKKEAEPSDQSHTLHLPHHIVIEILSRLPIKTLVSFKSVSKSWLNLVSADTHFAKLHRRRSATTELLLRPTYSKFHFGNPQFHNKLVHSLNHSLLFKIPSFDLKNTVTNTTISFNPTRNSLIFANTCNGLVCVYGVGGCSRGYALIFNPVAPEFIVVPMNSIWGNEKEMTWPPIFNCMLGFSEKQNRFKLVIVFYKPNSRQQFTEILTLEEGSKWREIGDSPNFIFRESVFLEQKVHFNFVLDGIHCFDFEKEEYGEVPVPSLNHEALTNDAAFGVFNGCLFLSLRGKCGFEVWVMKEYCVVDSWTKMFKVPLPCGCPVPLKRLENGEVLMLCKQGDYIVSCSLSPNRTRIVRPGDKLPRVMIAYSPTLLRLKDALAGYEAFVHDVDLRRAGVGEEEEKSLDWWIQRVYVNSIIYKHEFTLKNLLMQEKRLFGMMRKVS